MNHHHHSIIPLLELKHGDCTYVSELLSFFKIHFIITVCLSPCGPITSDTIIAGLAPPRLVIKILDQNNNNNNSLYLSKP